jgi:hydrogenase-1 operon protein HyaE
MESNQSEHPLIAALAHQHGIPVVRADEIESFVASHPATALLFAGDPAKYPEAIDIAVILPELIKALPGRLAAARVDPRDESELQARYGFSVWPCLVLLSPGGYLGRIERLRDWGVYLNEIDRLLAQAPSHPPGIGVRVADTRQACG